MLEWSTEHRLNQKIRGEESPTNAEYTSRIKESSVKGRPFQEIVDNKGGLVYAGQIIMSIERRK
jgi:hypothetical protein